MIVIQGNTDMKLAREAPMPITTRKTGRAQQIRVLKLVNKLKVGVTICL